MESEKKKSQASPPPFLSNYYGFLQNQGHLISVINKSKQENKS